MANIVVLIDIIGYRWDQ